MVISYTFGGTTVPLTVKIHYGRGLDNAPTDTIIRLFDAKGRLAAIGTALLHINDRFNRYQGRKLAFNRALLNYTDHGTSEQCRQIRRELWQSFMAQVRVR